VVSASLSEMSGVTSPALLLELLLARLLARVSESNHSIETMDGRDREYVDQNGAREAGERHREPTVSRPKHQTLGTTNEYRVETVPSVPWDLDKAQ